MLKSYKYRIYPEADQISKIDATINACRLIYNLALETKIYAWRTARINISSYDLQKQLTDLKKSNKWLYDIDSQSLNSCILNIDKAFKLYFKGAGFPKFKSKKGKQTFSVSCNSRKVDFKKSTLTIPKIKDIPIVLSRKFEGEIKTVTISKMSTGKYYASILVQNNEIPPVKPPINEKTSVGIDLGIKSFVVTSNGLVFEPNRYLSKSLVRLQCLQRRAAKKKKGSNNKKKAYLKINKLHEKITNQRYDYIHKVTSSIIHDNQMDSYMIEDLNIVGMMQNIKLSQAISDVSFGEFFRQMKYKSEWYGKNLIIINRFAPSSKRCNKCAYINKELSLSDREWICKCGEVHDRDLNAAINIKWFGLNNSPVESRGGPVES